MWESHFWGGDLGVLGEILVRYGQTNQVELMFHYSEGIFVGRDWLNDHICSTPVRGHF